MQAILNGERTLIVTMIVAYIAFTSWLTIKLRSRTSDQFMTGARGTLVERMGIDIVEASAQRIVGTMAVEGNTQPFGLLHGGASCVLAETLGSVGATMHAADLFGGYAVGVDIACRMKMTVFDSPLAKVPVLHSLCLSAVAS